MGRECSRRGFLGLLGSMAVTGTVPAFAAAPFRLGLTSVFLDNDAAVIRQLRDALVRAMGGSVEFAQRRTYQEVTGLLLEGAVDAAWLCGYPYLQHKQDFTLIGVPVWRGKPLYQSYLIVNAEDPAPRSLPDLRGSTHAFSDPDSNSGFLVTASDLARLGERPESFFSRTIFTYGHRNVVRAVASRLTRSGSVDGYVWEAMAVVEPALTARTRIVSRSEWLGFPPFTARRDRVGEPRIEAFRSALLGMDRSAAGREALSVLQLDAIAPGDQALFDGIAARMQMLERAL